MDSLLSRGWGYAARCAGPAPGRAAEVVDVLMVGSGAVEIWIGPEGDLALRLQELRKQSFGHAGFLLCRESTQQVLHLRLQVGFALSDTHRSVVKRSAGCGTPRVVAVAQVLGKLHS